MSNDHIDHQAVDAFLDDSLTLPVPCRDGKTRTFVIPAPPAEDGMRVVRLMDAGVRMATTGAEMDTEALNDAEEIDMYRTALGDEYGRLLKHLSWTRFRHVALTAVIWITQDAETAQRYWDAGGRPEAMRPAEGTENRAARRASSRAAKSTPRPDLRNGTSTRKGGSPGRKGART